MVFTKVNPVLTNFSCF